MRVHKFHPVASSAAQRGESSNFRSKIIIIIIFIFKMVMTMIMICKREFPKLDFRIRQSFFFLAKSLRSGDLENEIPEGPFLF